MKNTSVILFIPCLALLLNGCSSTPELNSIKMETDSSIENSKLADYLADGTNSISYSYKEVDDMYKVNVKAKVNNSFYANNPLGVLNILSRTVEEMDSDISDFCGRKDCEFGTLKVVSATSSKKDPYSLKIDTYDGDEVLVRDDVKYKRENLTYYKDPEGILPDPDYNENEDYDNNDAVLQFNDAVYQYMEDKFDEITNYGENYVPEIDDPKVVKAAAIHFDITEEEASEIYVNKAVEEGESYKVEY
ncbi:hypothetical protein [Priestia megaterium]|uniref:hypothetical protein n=1 Tax=Priestia megaterium TaxID=1404 RepID=UPI0012B7C0A6|nr:hypothetical protein [Priestia megaterium]